MIRNSASTFLPQKKSSLIGNKSLANITQRTHLFYHRVNHKSNVTLQIYAALCKDTPPNLKYSQELLVILLHDVY